MAAARRHAPVRPHGRNECFDELLSKRLWLPLWNGLVGRQPSWDGACGCLGGTAASETVRDADVDVDIDLIRSMCKCNPFEIGQKPQSGQDKIGQTGQDRKGQDRTG